MFIFHTIGVYLYGLAIYIAQFFNKKASQWVNGRKEFWNNLPEITSKNVVWFHCASLGEFDQGIPVMQALKAQHPDAFLMVTFFSPSGMNHYHKRNHPANWVGYLPLPTPANARKFIRYFQPQSVFFVKYEFWVNYLNEAKKNKANIYCISANFRKNQLFFGVLGRFFNRVLFLFDKIFVQNESSLKLLQQINYPNGILAGDTRIDKVLENKAKCYSDHLVENFLQREKAIILGSSWPIGEEKWLDYIKQFPQQKFIIAPHDISDKHILQLKKQFPKAVLYSDDSSAQNKSNIMIINCIGKLSNLYQYAKLAYIGGGFSGSLHNILEAAVFEIPVLIGPKHQKFPEAQALIDNGVVSVIINSQNIFNAISKIDFEKTQTQASNYFETNKNITSKILKNIKEI